MLTDIFGEVLHTFSEFTSNNTISDSHYKKYYTFSQRSYQTILTPSQLLSKRAIKNHFSIGFYRTKLTISRELMPNTTDFFHRRQTRQYFFPSQIWTYSKFLLTEISANSTFRKVFDFKKLKIIYCSNTYFCYDYKHLPFSNKP